MNAQPRTFEETMHETTGGERQPGLAGVGQTDTRLAALVHSLVYEASALRQIEGAVRDIGDAVVEDCEDRVAQNSHRLARLTLTMEYAARRSTAIHRLIVGSQPDRVGGRAEGDDALRSAPVDGARRAVMLTRARLAHTISSTRGIIERAINGDEVFARRFFRRARRMGV
jgi:hypothetical protein